MAKSEITRCVIHGALAPAPARRATPSSLRRSLPLSLRAFVASSGPLPHGRGSVRSVRSSLRPYCIVAFTLIELLVVVSIIALLVAILLPSLHSARAQTRSAVCRSNLHQLHLANANYAVENNDLYVPAATDMLSGFGGRHRWHGVREAEAVDPDPAKNTFDPVKGPLAPSLQGGRVKQCPERTEFVTDGSWNAFEAGTGGYGYNLAGIGSRIYRRGWSVQDLAAGEQYLLGWVTAEVEKPASTVMFTDAAYRQYHSQRGYYLTEYSFCEPPWRVDATPYGPYVNQGTPPEWWLLLPTIHFRHLGRTNVAWCDGHVTAARLTHSKSDLDRWRLGWFGPLTNEAFAPY
jgi:prepilin-type processing-associated H-X9-DG protein/prepilin-type N-terminal cleavage/methylation domain-containing protein